jgi:hypothetical protein
MQLLDCEATNGFWEDADGREHDQAGEMRGSEKGAVAVRDSLPLPPLPYPS